MTKELLQTLFVRSTVLIRAAVAMAVRQNLAKATTSPERSLDRPLMIIMLVLKSRHLRGPIPTEIHPLDMATTGRDNSLGTIVATMDGSEVALPNKIVQIIQAMVTRVKIETSLVIILITTIDSTTIIVCLTLILISKPVREITPAETKTMRDSTRIPHTVSKTMIGIQSRVVPKAQYTRSISNFRFVCCSKPPLCKARA